MNKHVYVLPHNPYVALKTGNIYHDSAPRYEVERLMLPASAKDYRLLLYNAHARTSSS